MYVPYIHNINHITSFVSVDLYYNDHMDIEKDKKIYQYQERYKGRHKNYVRTPMGHIQ
jgi:hypothetical protein